MSSTPKEWHVQREHLLWKSFWRRFVGSVQPMSNEQLLKLCTWTHAFKPSAPPTFDLNEAHPPGELEMCRAVTPPHPNPAGSPLTRAHTASHTRTHTHTLGSGGFTIWGNECSRHVRLVSALQATDLYNLWSLTCCVVDSVWASEPEASTGSRCLGSGDGTRRVGGRLGAGRGLCTTSRVQSKPHNTHVHHAEAARETETL